MRVARGKIVEISVLMEPARVQPLVPARDFSFPRPSRVKGRGGAGGTVTPERWGRVKEIFEAALQQAGSARVGFVAQAATDDPTLADEVLRMLASDEKAGGFLSGVLEGTLPRLASSGPVAGPGGPHIWPFSRVSQIFHLGLGSVYSLAP